jgi:hypothetical protein
MILDHNLPVAHLMECSDLFLAYFSDLFSTA